MQMYVECNHTHRSEVTVKKKLKCVEQNCLLVHNGVFCFLAVNVDIAKQRNHWKASKIMIITIKHVSNLFCNQVQWPRFSMTPNICIVKAKTLDEPVHHQKNKISWNILSTSHFIESKCSKCMCQNISSSQPKEMLSNFKIFIKYWVTFLNRTATVPHCNVQICFILYQKRFPTICYFFAF